jgi:pyruvate dehydrogenase E1 component beta subunit
MWVRQAITTALADEMREDPTVMMFGEDIAAAGGPFKTSEGLLDEFGPLRVRDTPISEMAFTGAAVGAAMMGMRPVIEIMFMEFLGVALDQLVTEGAKTAYLTQGELSVPLVVRASVGTGLGFGCQHSQTLENWVLATPGLKVVSPSDGQSAYGLLRSAIRDPNPVIVLEPRSLYAERQEVTTGEAGIVPIGKAQIRKAGKDVTVVALGGTVAVAAQAIAETGLDAELIDLLTLAPWDRETVFDSVARTGRLVVVEDAPLSGGWGHEIVSAACSSVFESLKSPPFRICAPDVPVPQPKSLERRYRPTSEEVARQLREYLTLGTVPQAWWINEGVQL